MKHKIEEKGFLIVKWTYIIYFGINMEFEFNTSNVMKNNHQMFLEISFLEAFCLFSKTRHGTFLQKYMCIEL